jgi:hypothetical protein
MLLQTTISHVVVQTQSWLGGSGSTLERHGCQHDLLGVLVATVVVIVSLGSYLGVLLYSSHGRPAERVFNVGYFLTLADTIIFSLVIPDSYNLVQKLGGEAYVSGLVIGVYKLGTFLGALAMFLLLRRHPAMWKEFARHNFLICGLCSIIGTSCWFFATLASSPFRHALPQNGPALVGLLLFGRVVGGIGAGLRLMMMRAQIPSLNSLRARPGRQASLLFAIHVGMGLGPLIAGSTRLVDNAFCPAPAHERHEPIAWVGMAIGFTCLFAVLMVLPLDDAEEFESVHSPSARIRQDVVAAQGMPALHQGVVVSCLSFSMLRAFVVSGGEVATAMLLEVEYKWSVAWIGIASGGCCLSCIPLAKCYTRYGAMMSVKDWVRVMLLVSTVGCLFYFGTTESLLIHGDVNKGKSIQAFSLLVADALVLPSFWLSDALSQGVMMNHANQEAGSMFSQSNVNMMQVLLLDGLSRTIGPALARGQADSNGRNGYATQQLALTIAAVLLSLIVILPKVQENGTPLVTGDVEDLKLSLSSK